MSKFTVAVIFTCPKCKEEVKITARDLARGRCHHPNPNHLHINVLARSIKHTCGGWLLRSEATGLTFGYDESPPAANEAGSDD